MSDEKKTGEDLLREPNVGFSPIGGSSPGDMETPFTQAIDLLAVTGDKELELMHRSTRQIADAAAISYNMIYRFGTRYMRGYIEQIERFSVSMGGRGREEVVQSLQAGSGVPDAFYESQTGLNKGFVEERCPERKSTPESP
jgi:hypothetical protein